MACTVERLRQATRDAPVVLLLGRLKNSAWVGSIPPVLLALPRATSAECARARSISPPPSSSLLRQTHAMCFMTQYVFMTETKHLRISQKHSMRAIFMQI